MKHYWLRLKMKVLSWRCRRLDDEYVLSFRGLDCSPSFAEEMFPRIYRKRIAWEEMVARYRAVEAKMGENK